jgi:hypothetical protein
MDVKIRYWPQYAVFAACVSDLQIRSAGDSHQFNAHKPVWTIEKELFIYIWLGFTR